MTDFDNLRGQWENTLRIERGYTFVDTAPLECHIGYDDKLRRTLLIISRHEVKIPPSSKTVEINRRRRKDGRFNLTLSLLSDNETAVFVEMCRDLLTAAENANDEVAALKNFWQRYKRANRRIAFPSRADNGRASAEGGGRGLDGRIERTPRLFIRRTVV